MVRLEVVELGCIFYAINFWDDLWDTYIFYAIFGCIIINDNVMYLIYQKCGSLRST